MVKQQVIGFLIVERQRILRNEPAPEGTKPTPDQRFQLGGEINRCDRPARPGQCFGIVSEATPGNQRPSPGCLYAEGRVPRQLGKKLGVRTSQVPGRSTEGVANRPVAARQALSSTHPHSVEIAATTSSLARTASIEEEHQVESSGAGEAATAAEVLIGLDVQLRRHHYHSPDEEAEPLDLIELGALANLEWDEKDGLWAQLDELVTFDITPARSSICIYLDEEPVVTLWASPAGQDMRWLTDWETDLTQSEQQHFLRRVGLLGKESTQRVIKAVDQLRTGAIESEEQHAVAAAVREWLAQR